MSEAASLAARAYAIKPSATVAVAQRARELKAAGKDILSFSVGEPDFATPENVCDAAKRAIDEGFTRYTSVRGVPELLQAICADSERRRPCGGYKPENVVVSVGAKHTLFNLAMALFEPGDEVIIPAPYWVSYPEQVRLFGAEPVVVSTGMAQDFKLTAEQLEKSLTAKTKAVILCSPSNPTGAAYARQELEALGSVLEKSSAWIIVDEIYSRLTYDGFQAESLVSVCPKLRDRLVVVDGVSKSHAMTGWRIGWMLGPAPLAKVCESLQGQATTNPTAIAQLAAVEALNGPQSSVEEMRSAFERRRNQMVDGLNKIEGLRCKAPQGAFYVFCNVEGLIGHTTESGTKLASDLDVAQYLLETAGCAVVPGTAFGAPGFVRLSYAVSEDTIADGLKRMAQATERLASV